MGQVIKRENITIIIGEYQKDGETKKRYKTIGEIVTMQGDDGSSYQFGEMWGPGGVVKFNIYQQEDKNTQPQQQQQNYQQQAPQQNYQQQNGQPMNPQQVQQQNDGYHKPNF